MSLPILFAIWWLALAGIAVIWSIAVLRRRAAAGDRRVADDASNGEQPLELASSEVSESRPDVALEEDADRHDGRRE